MKNRMIRDFGLCAFTLMGLSLQAEVKAAPVKVNAGLVTIDESFSSKPVVVGPKGLLRGSGKVGPLSSSGHVALPFGEVLEIQGDLHIQDTPSTVTTVALNSGGQSGAIHVLGGAHVGGALMIEPMRGNYNNLIYNQVPYTILTASEGISGNFSSVEFMKSPLKGFVVYRPADGYLQKLHALDLYLTDPFRGQELKNLSSDLVPSNFTKSNPKAVANNLVAIKNTTGFAGNSGLAAVYNLLATESTAVAQANLEQLQPAQIGAFTELQMNIGSVVASAMHTRSYCDCPGKNSVELWAEPYAVWNNEDSFQDQLGFKMDGLGVATGLSYSPMKHFFVGIGGAYDRTKLRWEESRGTGERKTFYAAGYLDYITPAGQLGLSVLGGFDSYKVKRNIVFATIDQEASSRSQGFEIISQLSGSLNFGRPEFKFSPYLNVDYFFLYQGMFHETGANSLDLKVQSHRNGNLRNEVGFQVRPIVAMQHGCFNPWIAIAWITEIPLFCPKYVANFVNEELEFKVKGWHHWWNFWAPQAGFSLTYKKFTFSAQYQLETGRGFSGQKLNARLDLIF